MKMIARKNNKKGQEHVKILGIDVLSTNLSELLAGIETKISHNNKFSVFTPNPELLLMAKQNIKLQKIINESDFNVPDGVALLAADSFNSKASETHGFFFFFKVLASWVYCFYIATFAPGKLKSKLTLIKGRTLFEKLIELAAKNNRRVFLLGGTGVEADLTEEKLKIKYKNINFKSAKGPKLNDLAQTVTEVDKEVYLDTVKQINEFKPHMLFVAFGNPKQEIWISENINNLNINMAMSVGGTFRYYSGLSKLPPQVVQNLGLEWFWRLITEPKRLIRILNAVFVFPLSVLKETLAKH